MSDGAFGSALASTFAAAVVTLLLLAAPSYAQHPASAPTPATAPASPKPSAEAYYKWLSGCLDSIEKDLPAITRDAEAAAKLYIQDGWEIGAWGDPGMVGEFNSRAGGMMRTSRPKDIEKAGWKGIVLFFLRVDSDVSDFAKCREFRKKGNLVLCFGSFGEGIVEGGTAPWDAMVGTHAVSSGVFRLPGGQRVVPASPVANIAALWTWTGEFVGALTRLGKMPPMHQSIMVPGAGERAKKIGDVKFHVEAPKKVEAGALGREYLAELRKSLAAVHEKDMAAITQVAEQAAAALKAGHKLHVFAHGHAIRDHIAVPSDTGLFHQVNRGLFELKDDPGIAKGDFVFCVGYDRVFEGWYFHDATTRMRKAGARFAWSMTDYNNTMDANIGPSALPKGETVVGQHWALGDAVASVLGYDVKILPPSGVIGEAIFRMTEAELLRILGPDASAKYGHPASAPATKP